MRANKGLAGLIAGDTTISKVDVTTNSLWYRGYDINELCAKTSFLEVAYLLLHEDLPTSNQLKEFENFESSTEDLSKKAEAMLKAVDKHETRERQMNRALKRMEEIGEDNKDNE